MRVTSFNAAVLSLALSVSAAGVASAQISNGNLNPLVSSSSVLWGTSASGPQTVTWADGGQYAYDPAPGDFGWTFLGGAGVAQVGSAWGFPTDPYSDGQNAFLQNYNGGIPAPEGNPSEVNPSSISQSITGVLNDQYEVVFYMVQRPGYGLNALSASVGGTNYTPTTPSSSWTAYSFDFTATGSPETLTFAAYAPGGSYDVDTGLADVQMFNLTKPGDSGPPSTIPIAPVPEGGATAVYLLFAGAVCFGTMLSISRNRMHSSA